MKSSAQLKNEFIALLDYYDKYTNPEPKNLRQKVLRLFSFHGAEGRIRSKKLRIILNQPALDTTPELFNKILPIAKAEVKKGSSSNLIQKFLNCIADELGISKFDRGNGCLESFVYASAVPKVMPRSFLEKIESRLQELPRKSFEMRQMNMTGKNMS